MQQANVSRAKVLYIAALKKLSINLCVKVTAYISGT